MSDEKKQVKVTVDGKSMVAVYVYGAIHWIAFDSQARAQGFLLGWKAAEGSRREDYSWMAEL